MNCKLIASCVLLLLLTVGSVFAAEICAPAVPSAVTESLPPPVSQPAETAVTVNPKAGTLPAATGRPKVVFQINQAADASAILRFVANYLAVEPMAAVAVVGYGGGADFMLKGARDGAGKPYADQLHALAVKGVVFKVCNNTLKARGLTAEAVAAGVTIVPGAVNEIIRLQTREGYAYFRH